LRLRRRNGTHRSTSAGVQPGFSSGTAMGEIRMVRFAVR
jgi:hypothetical protein